MVSVVLVVLVVLVLNVVALATSSIYQILERAGATEVI
jgi:hypothetical protein